MFNAIKFYIDKLVKEPALDGGKVLLLDPITTKIVSTVYSQTQILEQEVYLVELLGKPHENMAHFKAAVFIQPTANNIKLLKDEIREPKFSEYHIFFSNVVPTDLMSELAKADEFEVIKSVQEFYADFMAVNEDFFHLGANNTISLSSPKSRSLASGSIHDRNVNGILSVLLSLKRKPSQIRYQRESALAGRIASDLVSKIENDGIFDFRRQENGGPLLLLLDRRDDPITPLLTQFTYQAMIHELIGINDSRVKFPKKTPNISKDMQEIVVSSTQDAFFSKMKHAHMGDLGVAVKKLMDDYQKQAKKNDTISSIEDMQAFMERYPAFRSQSINASKHVTLMSELMRLTDKNSLLQISELEQDIAITTDHSSHKQQLLEKIESSRVANSDKLRLALLYRLKYEDYNESKEIKSILSSNGVGSKGLRLLDSVIDYAGDGKRAPGLFTVSIASKLENVFNAMTGGVSGMENHYTQHQPLLYNILDSILKGKLKDSAFPLANDSKKSSSGDVSKPSEIIVFIVGGATFEEATKIAAFNAANPSMKVLLGGSCVHNSVSFLKEIEDNFGH